MRKYFLTLGSLSIIISSICFSAEPTAKKILETADRARGGLSGGLSWTLDLTSVEASKTNHFVYDLKVLGDKVLAACQEPARCKGESYLFLGRNLWVYRTGLRKPLSLSPKQRLSGQASNGDIAATNYSNDYDAEILVGELATENVGEPAIKLKLKAKSSDMTYDRINYWVSKKSMLAIKAEFLTLEGVPFKTAEFEYNNSIIINGKTTPFVSKMTIKDVKNPALVSTLIYSKPKPANLSEQIFSVNKLAD